MQKAKDWKIHSNTQADIYDNDQSVSLERLSEMTGFPVKMIKTELFLGELAEGEPISMEELRSHMLGFLNRSLGKHVTDSEAV